MTLYNNPDIACDWPGCYSHSAELKINSYKADELRRKLAADHGWSAKLGSDFCGHHPELADHAPTLKKVTEGWSTGYRITCSCGWAEQENPWPPERSTAIRRWRKHLPEEGLNACMKLFMAARKAREAAEQGL